MKAVLVIDMPEYCANCPCIEGEQWYCEADKEFRECPNHSRPEWCPLRPMPEQMSWGHTVDYIEGYNACLEEITRETE